MQNDSIQYIRNLLDSQVALDPIPTGYPPRLNNSKFSFRAVMFDIYGTMLISSSGDVDQAVMTAGNLRKAFLAGGIKIINDDDEILNQILKDFYYTIRIFQEAARKNMILYPEIDILSIWKIILINAKRKKIIMFDDNLDIMLVVCVFEFLSNHVYPMPGLKEIIAILHEKCVPLGIISNAQFYTPILMNYFLYDLVQLSEKVKGFDHDLTVFSYKHGKGKPDPSLYGSLVTSLNRKYGISPSEVLLVGNDMIKDIYGAKEAGFKTALFAGDKRSLRLHENDKRTSGLVPDFVITNLKQVLDIVL